MDQKVFCANRRTILTVAGSMALLPRGALARTAKWVNPPHFDLAAMLGETGAVGLAGTVWQDGQTIWQGQAGSRVVDRNSPIGPDDLWHIGSNAKAMTAALWARLIEQGRASWNMPLIQAVEASGLDVKVHSGWGDRTVEDFLRHRAGLLDGPYVTDSWMDAAWRDERPLHQQRVSFVRSVLEAAPNGPLGDYQYGNANYVLAGALIEGVTGLTWEEAMQREIFAPLSIVQAGFGAPKGAQPQGHIHDGMAVRTFESDNPVADNPAALGPAGTVHISLADYGKFLRAMMVPGWLSQDSLTRLITPLPSEVYALGWIAPGQRKWASGPVLLHNGSNTMWFCTTVIAPARNLAMVSVSNDGTRGGRACSRLMDEMIAAVSF